MTQQRREAMTGSRRPAHRVDLRVTDAAGKELYQNLIRRRIRKINFIHNQGLIGFYEDCRPTLDAHPASLLRLTPLRPPWSFSTFSVPNSRKAVYPFGVPVGELNRKLFYFLPWRADN